jgi:hypothetical protein
MLEAMKVCLCASVIIFIMTVCIMHKQSLERCGEHEGNMLVYKLLRDSFIRIRYVQTAT